jgi:hypothetical protein
MRLAIDNGRPTCEVVTFLKRQVEDGGHELTGALALHAPAVSAPAGTSISSLGLLADVVSHTVLFFIIPESAHHVFYFLL